MRLVCLSATVSNAAELAAWIQTVRGPTTPVVELRRPVRLHDRYLVGDRTNDRVAPAGDVRRRAAQPRGRPPRRLGRAPRRPPAATTGRCGAAAGACSTRPAGSRPSTCSTSAQLLPAIVFIFSRNQCDEAARSCLAAGHAADRRAPSATASGRSSTPASRASPTTTSPSSATASSSPSSRPGIAAHHAGMVPAFKEAVEACFVEGLIKVVFATETLAVGINMPARTVVIEKLTKFTGDHHEMLTAGEYTQLTGRAGRRGIDDEGHAVVLWSPFVPFEQVAALAASRTFHLRSAFRPTYNMAANLVGTYTSEQAHHLLNLSFAQYQADRDVVRLEARLERVRANLAVAREQAESPYGDIWDYRRRVDEVRGPAPRPRRPRRPSAWPACVPGEVVHAAKGRYRGPGRRGRQRPPQGRHAPDDGDQARPTCCSSPPTTSTTCPRPLGTIAPADGVQPRTAPSTAVTSPGRSSDAKLRAVGGEIAASRRRRARTPSSPTPSCASGCAPPARPSGSSASSSSSAAASRATASRWPASSTACSTCSTVAATSTCRRLGADRRAARCSSRVFHESDLLVAECLLAGLLDGARRGRPRRAAVGVRVRAPQPRAGPAAVVPVGRRARRGGGGSRAISEDLAADERSTGPRRAPPARSRVRRRRPRLGRRARGWPRSSPTRSSPAATSCAR